MSASSRAAPRARAAVLPSRAACCRSARCSAAAPGSASPCPRLSPPMSSAIIMSASARCCCCCRRCRSYTRYYLGADALITGGHIGYRTLIQLMLPLVDVSLCAVLVPRYGAAGAALAATCTHIVLVSVLWTTLHILAREPLHAPPQGTATALPPTSQ